MYLGAITVSGFRGIGPATTLPLHPGPGLTLVVGRNGSGKSSFAEGAEVLLTGTSLRWEGRTKAWKLGWRNLHQAADASVAAELLVEGGGPLVATRTWSADADLGAGVVTAKAKGGKAQPLDTLGWEGALATFRPFLSYNELGSLLEDGPSALYDALSTVLGLEEFVAVHTRLADARKERQARVTACKAAATTLAVQAEQVGARIRSEAAGRASGRAAQGQDVGPAGAAGAGRGRRRRHAGRARRAEASGRAHAAQRGGGAGGGDSAAGVRGAGGGAARHRCRAQSGAGAAAGAGARVPRVTSCSGPVPQGGTAPSDSPTVRVPCAARRTGWTRTGRRAVSRKWRR